MKPQSTMTLYQQAQAIVKIDNLRKAHQYYIANFGCTMKQVMTFTSLPYNIIKEYSAIRTECLSVITAVIDVRYNIEIPCAAKSDS